MKRLLCVALVTVSSFANADDVGDADRLLAARDYGKALPIYQRLAEAGNAQAQLRLGEMYWFGDGTPSDLNKAAQWFQKSAAAGNADAAASLASLKRRETHGSDITYWTTAYQGEDLVSGKFACKAPAVPAVSRTTADIKAVNTSIKDWRDCYNGFVENVNAALPPGKMIPAEVLDMMTPAEAQQAQRHLDQVYNKVIADARRDAQALTAREEAWLKETERYVSAENQRNAVAKDDAMRLQRRMADERRETYRDPYGR